MTLANRTTELYHARAELEVLAREVCAAIVEDGYVDTTGLLPRLYATLTQVDLELHERVRHEELIREIEEWIGARKGVPHGRAR